MSDELFKQGYEEGYKAGFEAGQNISRSVQDGMYQKLPSEFAKGIQEVTQEFLNEYEIDGLEIGDEVKVIRDMYGNIIGILGNTNEE